MNERYDMEFDALIFQFPHDESMKPVRISSVLWNRILAAARAFGGLVQERWNPSEARQFANAVRAALEPPAAAEASRRFGGFLQKPDPGAPLRDPDVRGDVEAVLAVFEKGAVLVQPRATPSALRALPDRGVSGTGQAGKKLPLKLPATTR